VPEFTLPRDEIITEYAEGYRSGAMLVRPSYPELEDIYPLKTWMEVQRREGAKVHRRRIIVIEDWIKVDAP
jgi:hypothetical protein